MDINNLELRKVNGGYLGVQRENSVDYIVKFDEEVKQLWVKIFEGGLAADGKINDVIEVKDGFVVTGVFKPQSKSEEAFIIKYDNDGNQVWKKNHSIGVKNNFASVHRL